MSALTIRWKNRYITSNTNNKLEINEMTTRAASRSQEIVVTHALEKALDPKPVPQISFNMVCRL